MDELPERLRENRMDTFAPGVAVEAKIVFLLGLAGGLFLTILLSFAIPRWQYAGLAMGLGFGVLGAAIVTLRARRERNNTDRPPIPID